MSDELVELQAVTPEPSLPTLEDLQTQHRPEDAAAAFFQMNESKLARLVDGLKLNQLQRIFMHVALAGLGKKPYKLIGDDNEPEKQTAYVFNELVTQRFVMQLALEMERAENAHKKELEKQGEENVSSTEEV